MHTGDIGEIDADGYLKIIDRKKELIITAGGKNISPANLEAELKMIPFVGQACAVGEKRPFVAALVVLDPDASASWAAAHGLTGDDATMLSLADNPEVQAEIDAGLVEVMAKFNNAESVKKVKVLGEEWLPDSDLLTPTSKLKRRGILDPLRRRDRSPLRQVVARQGVGSGGAPGCCRMSGDQAVADAAGGDDQRRFVGLILDLHPQAADVGVDEARIAEVLVAPHPLEQLIARQHRAGVVGELAQQPELGLGQVELLAALERDALLAAQLDVAERTDRRQWRRTRAGAPGAGAARIRAASSFGTTGLVT